MQRTAATLVARDHHLEPVPGEHLDRGRVHRPEELGHEAAREERHPTPPGSFGGDHERRAEWVRQRRQHALGPRQRRQEPQQAARSQQALQSASLIEAKCSGCRAQHPGRADQMAQDQPLKESRRTRARAACVDLGTHALDQIPIAHARRTRRLAGTTGEAEVGLLYHLRIQGDATFGNATHEVDPPAGRAGLASGLLIGGAVRQAESAVYAVQGGRVVDQARGRRTSLRGRGHLFRSLR
jgi:hypothetical protein